ncbi:MAG: hypothetical protein WBG17_00675 [Burkholderiaceae bacterium]
MRIAMYHRDASGTVKFMGSEDWDSREQALQYYFRDDEVPDTVEMMGWPHSKVTWHGDLGFGEPA